MSRRNQFPLFLVLLLLFSTIVALPHYHDNTADDHDCPLCIANNHQSATGPLAAVFDGIPCLTETTVVVSVPARTENLFVSSRRTRGPPA